MMLDYRQESGWARQDGQASEVVMIILEPELEVP